MPPEVAQKVVVSRQTSAGTQRIPQFQTSGILKLPSELLLEIFSYFDDHRDFIQRSGRDGPSFPAMKKVHVERSTAIRRLTMTCWALRNALLPALWKDAEGCMVPFYPHKDPTYGLYAQCEYLLSNPTIAAHVQVFSVDLRFKYAPKDLMKKFIDTLLRLPNLRRLELLSVSHRPPVTAQLKLKCAVFPKIREMMVDNIYPDFIKSCPNLESLTFRRGVDNYACQAIELHGAGLKRVTGVSFLMERPLEVVVQSCPKLQEIGLVGDISERQPIPSHVFSRLRQIDHLAVVEVDLNQYRASNHSDASHDVLGGARDPWKRGFIGVLKNSTSKDRKLFRWRVVDRRIFPGSGDLGIPEYRAIEVLPKTSL